ncbi:MAG: 1-acyl-sn-glycerol-3-phosphate acyltransferase [Myxococcota bacterium]|jgi:1-acyl-sn-glycerol-3-phosphate acyltransferase
MRLVATILSGLRLLHAPVFLNLERAPQEGPRLFVANHSLFVLLDFPQLFWELMRERGIFMRGLGHSAHFKVPGWGTLLSKYGLVEASRENCAALFAAGEPVLVFPGGGREAAKQRGESYQLIWKQRLGFARMAIAHGATVVPLACYGAEDAWRIVRDGPELLSGRSGPLLRRVAGKLGASLDEVPPLARGLGPTMWPRPVRLYFSVGEPIETASLRGQEGDDDIAWALRQQVAGSIQGQLDELAAIREADPESAFRVRARAAAGRRLRALPGAGWFR